MYSPIYESRRVSGWCIYLAASSDGGNLRDASGADTKCVRGCPLLVVALWVLVMHVLRGRGRVCSVPAYFPLVIN